MFTSARRNQNPRTTTWGLGDHKIRRDYLSFFLFLLYSAWWYRRAVLSIHLELLQPVLKASLSLSHYNTLRAPLSSSGKCPRSVITSKVGHRNRERVDRKRVILPRNLLPLAVMKVVFFAGVCGLLWPEGRWQSRVWNKINNQRINSGVRREDNPDSNKRERVITFKLLLLLDSLGLHFCSFVMSSILCCTPTCWQHSRAEKKNYLCLRKHNMTS